MSVREEEKKPVRNPYAVRISKDLAKEIKVLAAQEETEVYVLFEEALRKLLAERRRTAVKNVKR